MTDIYSRIASGEFDNKLPFPDRVPKPAILSLSAGKLTPDEIRDLPATQQGYNDAIEARKIARQERDKETSRLAEAFVVALFDDHGIPTDHPFGLKMFDIAWDRGHSHGHHDVAVYFGELAGLWDEALVMVGHAINKTAKEGVAK